MADEKDIVKDVVEVLHDGHKGFAEIGKHLQDVAVKTYFMKESLTHSQFAGELEAAIGLEHDAGGRLHQARFIVFGAI
jgi:hypothetical protein